MQLSYLLFLLTIGQGGELNSAYSHYPDKDECEGALIAVASIFEASNVKTAYQGCVKTAQSFTPFEHNVPKDAPQFTSLNHLSQGKLEVRFEKDMNSCKKAMKALPQGRNWCAHTHQKER